ncbi:unnamed protein product [Somion occarium]|uniref:Glycoside hydrolase family 71 protein n=1 Tax=Somion occarium TaxID=3059160 RepID=A0ABP1DTM7_9APHY
MVRLAPTLILLFIQLSSSDIQLAQSKGIDGFALNAGHETWQPGQISNAYTAALNFTDFKLFLSFDMSSFPCQNVSDGDPLRQMINGYAQHPNQVQVDGKMLISTFVGDNCTFGAQSVDQGWLNTVKSNVSATYFIPNFNAPPETMGTFTSIDGIFNWNAAWPESASSAATDVTLFSATNTNITFDPDQRYIDRLGERRYMAGVSPWFFTHYGPPLNKNWIYRADEWLLIQRWQMLVENRDKIAFAQIISWNDYSESHYVGPYEGTPPDGTNWVQGFDHTPWLDLMQYYITAYKTGSYPDVTDDRIFLWGRLYPANMTLDDPIGIPDNWQWASDKAWGVALLGQPGTLHLTCGTDTTSIPVNEGQNLVQLSLSQSCGVTSELTRGKKNVKVMDYTPLGFNFSTNPPPQYNFNAFVAASPAGAGVTSSAILSSTISSWRMLLAVCFVVSVFLS